MKIIRHKVDSVEVGSVVKWRNPDHHSTQPELKKYIEEQVQEFSQSADLNADLAQINSPMHHGGTNRTEPNHVTVQFQKNGVLLKQRLEDGRETAGFHVYIDENEAKGKTAGSSKRVGFTGYFRRMIHGRSNQKDDPKYK